MLVIGPPDAHNGAPRFNITYGDLSKPWIELIVHLCVAEIMSELRVQKKENQTDVRFDVLLE